ncbi:MAG: hypothetical protein ACO3PB_05145, partial [Miltoncostaeaceae bacterium]
AAPPPGPRGEVAPGTTMSPPRYLAMVRAAVAAARAASIRLDALPASPTPVQAERAAPGLAAAATRAALAARQLSAARLEDQRLEEQRREIGPLYVALAAALRKAALAAADGDVVAMGQSVNQAAVQAGRIHEASAPGSS